MRDSENSSAGRTAGGRPDQRFPIRAETPMRDAAVHEGPVLVSVVATVNLTKGLGQIVHVHPVPNAPRTRLPESSPVVLQFKTKQGASVGEYPVEVKLNSELGPGDDRTGLVDAIVRTDAAARVIDLLIRGKIASTFMATARPPALRGVRTVQAGEKELHVAFEADRESQEGETFFAQLSADGGRTWHTVAIGLKDPAFSLDRTQYRPGDVVQIRVAATNGFETSAVTSERIRI